MSTIRADARVVAQLNSQQREVAMLWHAMPPELNTARLLAGAGQAPMLATAMGWQALAAAFEAQAAELSARLSSLGEAWTGGSSDKALSAAQPMGTWLHTAAQQA